MQLRQLQHLVALADQGSFGRAAQAVHLSQPALSRSIDNLEEVLQARLIDRAYGTVRFTQAGELVLARARELLADAALTRQIETDGPIAREYMRIDLVDTLHREVWGQGFAPPTFSEEVEVVSQRLVGEKHLSLKLRHQGQPIDAMWFSHTEPL
eukprot:gene56464-75395_t